MLNAVKTESTKCLPVGYAAFVFWGGGGKRMFHLLSRTVHCLSPFSAKLTAKNVVGTGSHSFSLLSVMLQDDFSVQSCCLLMGTFSPAWRPGDLKLDYVDTRIWFACIICCNWPVMSILGPCQVLVVCARPKYCRIVVQASFRTEDHCLP